MSDEMENANRRAFVEKMYPGPAWKRRVKTMPDSQVFAIYKRERNKPKPKRKASDDGETPF